MTTKKRPAKAAPKHDDTGHTAEPAVTENANDPRVFEQGRQAALGSISKEDAPYDPSDHNHKVWLKGWNSVQS